jgi:hypothetical protein
MILFYGNPLNSARGCIQMVVTAVVVTENVCISRRWKDESVVYGICKQPSPSFTHIVRLKPDYSSVYPACPETFSAPRPEFKIP